MNTNEADKDAIERENPSYIEFKDNSNCKHRCPGRERQPGIASPSGDNNPSPRTARPRRMVVVIMTNTIGSFINIDEKME
jgi:hypothetical protein